MRDLLQIMGGTVRAPAGRLAACIARCLLFGQESSGVPKEVHKVVNERLIIPMLSGLRSINVSSSVAIVVGEACRQLKLF